MKHKYEQTAIEAVDADIQEDTMQWHSVTECVGTKHNKQSHASIVLLIRVLNGHSRTSESPFVLITINIIHSAAFYSSEPHCRYAIRRISLFGSNEIKSILI